MPLRVVRFRILNRPVIQDTMLLSVYSLFHFAFDKVREQFQATHAQSDHRALRRLPPHRKNQRNLVLSHFCSQRRFLALNFKLI